MTKKRRVETHYGTIYVREIYPDKKKTVRLIFRSKRYQPGVYRESTDDSRAPWPIDVILGGIKGRCL
jgi:hypothetical protein